jgi:hypothetical protein
MNNAFRILIISSRGPEETVFESQVLDIISAWRKYGNVSLLYRSRLPKQVQVDGVRVTRIARILPELSRMLLYGERLLNSHWRWKDDFDLVHCRGAVGAWQVLRSMDKKQRKDAKVLYDCRGIVVEEMEGTWKSSWKRILLPMKMSELRKIEEYVVNEVDVLTAVSDGLSTYLEHYYGRKADRIIRPVVNPAKFFFSNTIRTSIRQSLGINEEQILFIFVGGGNYWQSLNLLKNWWNNSRKNDFTLLILTHNPSDYDKCLSESTASPGRIIIKSVSHQEVSSYMCAADFGILFREAGVVNNVASPVKLSEYLCTGLKVLTNLPVYQRIQSDDIIITDVKNLDSDNDFSIRDNAKREFRARKNIERFSAENAVKEIYDFIENKFPCSS